jgi:hypothetical protein
MPALSPLGALLLLSGAANAKTLVFDRLSLSADDGVTLAYSISPASWGEIEPITRMGTAPTIVVQFGQTGDDRSARVDLFQGALETTLAGGAWPAGMSATISLYGGVGDFDGISCPGGSGASVTLPISGGGQGGGVSTTSGGGGGSSSGSDGGSWSTTGGSSVSVTTPELTVEDVGDAISQLAALAQAEQARRAEAQYAAQQQADWEAAIQQEQQIRAIMNDPGHPVSHACSTTFGSDDDYQRCVRRALKRNYGPEEILACNRLDIVGQRMACIESLDDRRHVATGVINACIDSYGADREGLNCIERTQETRFDPSADVRACGLAFSDYALAKGCIDRYAEVSWEPAAVLHACVQGFEGEDQLVCAKLAAASGKPPADRIEACVTAFTDEEQALECVHITAHSTADCAPAIPICASLFEPKGKRYDCLELLRSASDRDPERLQACAVETSNGKRMKCVEGR